MASYSNSRSHILAIMNSSSGRTGSRNFLFWHVFYRVHSSFRSFENYQSYQMDCWGAFECTRLVETLHHLKTCLLGNQENSIDHNFVLLLPFGRDIQHLTRDKWQVTPDTWHLTPDIWHVTHTGGWTFSQNFWKIWRKRFTELTNESMTRLYVEQPWLHLVC